MRIGKCKLCAKTDQLCWSHVWPAWAYKRYASDINRGGRFIDLAKGGLDNHQLRFEWFCSECDNITIAKWEKYARDFCDQIENAPTEEIGYNDDLLKFTVSISWRSAMAFVERNKKSFPDLQKASKNWRQFLISKKRRIEPHSQHLFIVHDRTDVERHKALGGNVFPKENIVFSQIGPLWIFGLISRKQYTLEEIDIWDSSKILASGGSIRPISEWKVNEAISKSVIKFLWDFEKRLINRSSEIVPRIKDRL